MSIPIGLDAAKMPVGLVLIQTAWEERKLIKLASAIEDLRNQILGPRPTPQYREYHAKNVPIGRKHTSGA